MVIWAAALDWDADGKMAGQRGDPSQSEMLKVVHRFRGGRPMRRVRTVKKFEHG